MTGDILTRIIIYSGDNFLFFGDNAFSIYTDAFRYVTVVKEGYNKFDKVSEIQFIIFSKDCCCFKYIGLLKSCPY